MKEARSCRGDKGGDCGKAAGKAGATSAAGRAASITDAGCAILADSVLTAAAATG